MDRYRGSFDTGARFFFNNNFLFQHLAKGLSCPGPGKLRYPFGNEIEGRAGGVNC